MEKSCLALNHVSAALAVTVLCLVALSATTVEAQLVPNYYLYHGCPRAEQVISSAVLSAYNKDKTTMPGVLRIHFHDCFVNVCLTPAGLSLVISELTTSVSSISQMIYRMTQYENLLERLINSLFFLRDATAQC